MHEKARANSPELQTTLRTPIQSLSPSPGPSDSEVLCTPRTFRRLRIPSLAGTEIAKKILLLRDLLTHGADCRPLEVLDDLCRFCLIS